MKKVLCLFLSIILTLGVLGSVPFTENHFYITAQAVSSGTCGDNLTWTIDDNRTLTICGTGDMYNYSFRQGLYAPWYKSRYEIFTVIIDDGVTSIGSLAFYDCRNISSVTIGNGVKSIGEYAFGYCESLTSVLIPDSVTQIGYAAFYTCESLASVTIPDGVVSIESETFQNCVNLNSITLPDSIREIGYQSFYNTGYFNNEDNWENKVLYINNHLVKAIRYADDISDFNGVEGKYVIKEGTITIAQDAFGECRKLTAVTIPHSVRAIGDSAFSWCISLTSIKIPEGITAIEKSTFEFCKALTSIVIPNSVTSIGDSAFLNCIMLSNIFYTGTKKGWRSIEVGSDNDALTDGTDIHYETEDHIPSDWIVAKKATVNATGSKYKECTVCQVHLKSAKIPQLKCSTPKLKTIANTASGVKITWGKVTGADSYEIYRKVKGGSYSKVGTTGKTYFTDKTAKSGKQYDYIVKAVNEVGASSSDSLSIRYLADTTLKTPVSTKKGVTLKWSKVTGAQGYIVYRKTGNGSYSKLATVKGVSKTTYLDKSAKKNKKYTYKVKAYYGKTYSEYSNTKTIKDKY